MSDLFNQVTSSEDFFTKLLAKIPGFTGYIERQNRRTADKLLRDTVANEFEEVWKRISTLQSDLVSQGGLEYVDDLEKSAIKYRQFIDRVRNASYGYSGVFDAIKINEAELAKIYEYDISMLTLVDEANRAVDTVEASISTDGLPAAIRNLRTVAGKAVDIYNHRSEIVLAQNQASQ